MDEQVTRTELEDEIDLLKDEVMGFRKALWINHGCKVSDLYGDDGEMQCQSCAIDFKRMSLRQIRTKWFRDTMGAGKEAATNEEIQSSKDLMS